MEVTSNILPGYIIGKPTPSAADGVTPEEERRHRTYGCELVLQGGTVLGLPQVVIITGQNILNRFYYRKSLKRFDVFSIAMGSLLLALKVEECFKTLRDILFAFHFIYARRKGLHLQPMELGGQQYTLWKNELIMMERYILKELGFSLYNIMDHPHKYILYFVKVLNGSEALANAAWSYLNDSMRLDISLRFEAQAIACAAIFLAGRKLGVALPEEVETGHWWQVFGASTKDVQTISDEILTIYDSPKVGWLEPLAKVDYLSPESCAMFDQVIPQAQSSDSKDDARALSSTIVTQVPFPAAAGKEASEASGRSQKTRSGRDSAQSALGGATPEASASRSSTPERKETRAVSGGNEGGGRKLERKWMSIVGDIDKMECAIPGGTVAHVAGAPVPVEASAFGSERSEQPFVDRGASSSRARRGASQEDASKDSRDDRYRSVDDCDGKDRRREMEGRDERDGDGRKRDRSDSRGRGKARERSRDGRRDGRDSRRRDDSRDRGHRREDSRSRDRGRDENRDRRRDSGRDSGRDGGRDGDRERRRGDSRDRVDRGRGRY